MELSIIIPVYNVEEYLEECLLPLQNIDPTNHEVILVNDGSTDNSVKVAEKFLDKIPNMTIIHQKNGGLSAARNAGLRAAQGKFVFFYDSDDFINWNNFIPLVREIDELNLDIIGGNGYKYSSDSSTKQIKPDHFRTNLGIASGPTYFLGTVENKEYTPMVWLYLYRKDFLTANDLFFTEGIIYEDEDFTGRCFSVAKKVKYISKLFYYYRLREQSIIRKFDHKYLDPRGVTSLSKIMINLDCFGKKLADKRSLEVLNTLQCRLVNDLLDRYLYYKEKQKNDLIKVWEDQFKPLKNIKLPMKFHIKNGRKWIKYYFRRSFS